MSNWSAQTSFAFTILSFLNVSKYPPSLQYILMTLGTCIDLSWSYRKPIKYIHKKDHSIWKSTHVLLFASHFDDTPACINCCSCQRVQMV